MHFLGFLRLMYQIFVAPKPDIAVIQKLGLLATKIGQMYALRSDFLPVHKTRELMKLYEDNFSGEYGKNKKKLWEEDFESHFSHIDEEPFAEASIGVVYAASRDSKDVVIKAIKSNFQARFLKDVARMKRFFRVCIFFYPKLKKVADPIGTLEDVARMTIAELDLINEIRGKERLEKNYSQHQEFLDSAVTHPLKFHTFYEDISSQKILVTERIGGESFNALLESHRLPYEALLDFFFIHVFGMLQTGYFHEDIHPGNIFLQDDGSITMVDTGSIGFASEKIRTNLFAMFVSLVRSDFGQAAHDLANMAENTDEIQGERFQKFLERFLDLYADFSDKTLSELSLTNQMMRSIKLAVHSGFVFERGMFPIIKSFMYLDGMVLRCRPDTYLMRDIEPMVDRFESFQNS